MTAPQGDPIFYESSHRISCNWSAIGSVNREDRNRLAYPQGIPDSPGVYRLVSRETNQIYAGEGKSLHRRLWNYANAGWRPGRPARTNRRVQGWIIGCLERGAMVELEVCTSASIADDSDVLRLLDLANKYHRLTLEGLIVVSTPNMDFMNAHLSR